ncbi:MAG: carboxypeptidase regulatory-like domain-containing protein [Planctomycetes bacterium]|nr:carboxypeptidase regulatory-like domain-containing protein [Planctomycetota bacterium]
MSDEGAKVESSRRYGVTGRVEDLHGEPVGGAVVSIGRVTPTRRDVEDVATSDARGRFAFSDARNSFLIGARAAGYAPSIPVFLTFDAGRKKHEIALRLEVVGGGLVGRVTTQAGEPVEGAVVRARARTERVTPVLFDHVEHTDDGGNYHASGLAAGTIDVLVRAEGFAAYEVERQVLANADTRLDVELLPGARIEGVVRRVDGSIVPGAFVQCGDATSLGYRSVQSDADGRYEFVDLATGDHGLFARHRESGSGSAVVSVVQGETRSKDLVLHEGVVMTGRCIDSSGRGVGGIRILARPREGGPGRAATTDERGVFRIVGLSPKLVEVETRTLAFERVVIRSVDPAAGSLTLHMARRPPPSVAIRGRVVDPNGVPLVGASVTSNGLDHHDRASGFTDDQGAIHIGLLRPGRCRVRIEDGRYPTFVAGPFERGPDQVIDLGTVRMQTGGRVRCRTMLQIERGEFACHSMQGCWLGSVPFDGKTALSGLLPPGEHRANLRVPGREFQQRVIFVEAGVTRDVTFDPARGNELEFKFSGGSFWGDVLTVVDEASRIAYRSEIGFGDRRRIRLRPGSYVAKIAGQSKSFDVPASGETAEVEFTK